MCGIFGYLGKRADAGKIVLDGLKQLEYRGYDSWGVVVATTTGLKVQKDIGKIGDVKRRFPAAALSLGHTRWATHGGVLPKNAHPHLDCQQRLAIVHNGIIENYAVIKSRLVRKGHRFLSETDSEVAAHLLEENLKRHSLRRAFQLTFNALSGLNALIALDSQSQTLLAAKSGSPLVIGFGKGENLLASDAAALLPYTRKVHFLEDGEMVEIKKDSAALFTVATGAVKKFKAETLTWRIDQAHLGKYRHFMIKEIAEQPQVLLNMANNEEANIRKIAALVRQAYGTFFIGCGSAAYACLCGTYLFSRVAKRHANFAVGSEFAYLTDFLTAKSLVMAFSQSGETIDIIDAVKKAREKKARVLAVTNNLGSTLYRMADSKMLLGAGPEKCVLATKSFTAKLGFLLLLSAALANKFADGQNQLKKAVVEVQRLLKPASLRQIRQLAQKIKTRPNIYVIGRGLSFPIALESALKIKEASYIHAEGFAAGELKHGFLALIDKGTPCLVFAPHDETYSATLSGAMEVKARGGFIIGVGPKREAVFDVFIEVKDCGDASSVPHATFAQLLGYYLAVLTGKDPDKPRNLAKSVTVK